MQVIQNFVGVSGNFSELAGFQAHNHSSICHKWQDESPRVTKLLGGGWSSVSQR
jgi:hypothetical protein